MRVQTTLSDEGEKGSDPIEDGDKVKVHYTGKLRDGTQFESTHDAKKPLIFYTGRATLRCWNEAVLGLKKGSKGELICPSSAAYGAKPMPNIPPYSPLIFNFEIVDV
mmetsp:Transcript_24246/g.30063  ORF Transcript_24246/g.30063 Transcript_24246/m.30063 type:complete len:107 (-) Transcript_24246:1108-1428(-)